MLSALTRPVEDPILVFGLAILVFLTAPLVIRRFRLPGIIGIIVVGAAIGPNGVGLLERDETIILLGEVGIVYLLFLAGLEINLSQFIRYTDRSVVFGLLSFLVPQAVGMVVGYSLLGLSLGAASLFAAIFASHTLLAYPVVAQLGIATRESVTATIGGTIITDTLALLVLAVVIAAEQGELGPTFWLELAGGLALFFAGIWLLVPRLGRWFFRTVERESYVEFLFVMAVLFGCAYLAELARVEPIIGAFLAGLALNRLIPEHGTLMNRIEFVGNALFIPFFLLSVGMLVDVRVLAAGLETIVFTVTLIVLVVTTKYAAAWLTARLYGYSHAETMTMFGLSVGQAAAALAIVLIGFDVGLLGEAMLNAVVLMILVVSVLSPTVVDRYGTVIAHTSKRTAYDRRTAPQRVLIPFSSALPDTDRDRLLECGMFIRDHGEEQPLILVSVARPGAETSSELAAIAATFEDVEAIAAGAEVPIERETRIDESRASGIVRATYENRATTVVVPWDGSPPTRGRQIGSTIDDVLARTTQQVVVTTLRQPLNTTREIVVVLPPGVGQIDGFYEAIQTVEHLASSVGASIRAIAVGHETERYERLFDLVEPDVSVTVERVDGWPALDTQLRSLEETTFVSAISPRRGAVGWHPELRGLPVRLTQQVPGSVAIVYPARSDRDDDRQFLQFG
ncbi:cation:proton antiporter [Natronolimnobius baerhuensis]|uniref:Cation/H(+) antiporter n=1 Tax=Natronolimnobius baerhuensis TaxID=253108 RepID=A0A202EBJ7_9EURY|nr:cation:proton antiporter [Natronolimnobius baerhuensis]OVE85605.1 cation/H(+) antiporter [Natronolimnobius baerhuensis]